MDSLSTEQILTLGKSHTLNKTQLLYILGRKNNMLLACGDALTYIDQHPAADYDLDQVWRDCPRADWWYWLISNIISLAQSDAYLHINKKGYWLHLRDFNKMFDKFDGEWEQRKTDFNLIYVTEKESPRGYRDRCHIFVTENNRLLVTAVRPYLPDWETIIVPGLLSVFRFRSMLWKEHRNASKEI